MTFNEITSPESIANRLVWLREYTGLKKQEFAASINASPSQLSNWESATNRLSLDGALQINARYGTSLDFLYLGRVETLPQNMRSAWASRSLDNTSSISIDKSAS
ncbi:helix-turn-helix domain-containing protein [Pseudovibrio sp. W64]|uniref:helix-turn-helix domain-containing protein n=1 Tax=Pseudovibrio sp. W64 TaxID=1735583 RepID=UPI0007AEE4D8|nr:helix-turn-helix transcriptional regulator [Pseudovibrio sp. W64]